jgi:hypothetical protein
LKFVLQSEIILEATQLTKEIGRLPGTTAPCTFKTDNDTVKAERCTQKF